MSTEDRKLTLAGSLLALAVFLVRIAPWLFSDLWYDEVLTLRLYLFGSESPWAVCRNYAIANNHILMTVVNWLWLRTTSFNLLEAVLRFPAVLCGLGLLLLVTCHWRRFIGARAALLGGMLLAASPVFTAFAYQMRGYSLTMLLSALAVSGMLEIQGGRRGFGQCLLCLSAVLQPLVMPSSAMMAAVPVIWLAWADWRDRRGFGRICLDVLPVCIATMLGLSYYLTLLPQLRHAAVDAGGWPSSWLVAGHLLLAFAVHLGPLALLLAVSAFWLRHIGWRHTAAAPVVLAAAIVFTAAVPLLMRAGGHAPFPRVFLVLLPFVTLAGLLALRAFPSLIEKKLLYLALLLLIWGCSVERVADFWTRRKISHGQMPQNLLAQYYRGFDDNSRAAAFAARLESPEDVIILVNEYDEPAFAYYWERNGMPPEAILVRNRLDADRPDRRLEQRRSLMVLARSEEDACELFALAGRANPFQIVAHFGTRTLYADAARPEPAGAPPREQDVPRFRNDVTLNETTR